MGAWRQEQERRQEQWYIESMPGERSAAWWLSLGHTTDEVIAKLMTLLRLSEDAAWVAVERATGGPVAPTTATTPGSDVWGATAM